MIIDKLATQYRERIVGHDLVGQYEAGIPMFKVRLKIEVLKKQEIPTIAQFVLRLVALGIADETSLAENLGLEVDFIRNALVYLDVNQLITRSNDHPGMIFVVTQKGNLALTDKLDFVYTEHLYAQVDGFTGTISPLNEAGLIDRDILRKGGFWLLNTVPGTRPTASNLNKQIPTLTAIFKQEVGSSKWQLLDIVDVERSWPKYKRVNVLVFRDRTTRRLYFRVFEGYEPNEEYAQIFSRRERAGGRVIPEDLLIAATEAASVDADEQTDSHIAKVEEVHIRIQDLLAEKDAIQTDLQESKTGKYNDTYEIITTKTQRINELEQEVSGLRATLGSYKIIEDAEHRQFLEQALNSTQRRLLIVSPWIKEMATDRKIVRLLEAALQRGSWVAIGYGMDLRKGQTKADFISPGVEQAFNKLGQDYKGRFYFEWLGTHAKILVCDQIFGVITSFNWLSYRGDQGFRQETGTYSEDINFIRQAVTRATRRFKALPSDFILEGELLSTS